MRFPIRIRFFRRLFIRFEGRRLLVVIRRTRNQFLLVFLHQNRFLRRSRSESTEGLAQAMRPTKDLGILLSFGLRNHLRYALGAFQTQHGGLHHLFWYGYVEVCQVLFQRGEDDGQRYGILSPGVPLRQFRWQSVRGDPNRTCRFEVPRNKEDRLLTPFLLKAHLVQCGRKFMSLIGVHHCECFH